MREFVFHGDGDCGRENTAVDGEDSNTITRSNSDLQVIVIGNGMYLVVSGGANGQVFDHIDFLQVFFEHFRIGDAFARLALEIDNTDTIGLDISQVSE